MVAELVQIQRDVRDGRLPSSVARGKVRTMHAKHGQFVDLHDTLIGEEDELTAFAETTPDAYQREFTQRFEGALTMANQPALASTLASPTSFSRPGGALTRVENYEPASVAPSEGDLRNAWDGR